ncbi:hypothetical protein ACHAXA_011226 [Cyclostephanos tholiformis]|uniref:Uncharacterized protein n=1 Tax=Cyclostephanos tholiformis TaxID=382380 RepID=A0ABD3R0T8_9STRA
MKRPYAIRTAVHLFLPTLLSKNAAHSLRSSCPRRAPLWRGGADWSGRAGSVNHYLSLSSEENEVLLPNNNDAGLPPSQAPLISRRSVLVAFAAASLILFPALESSSGATADDPLGELSLGTATWCDAAYASQPSSSIPLSARIVPPSFATYLSRFLLHYDEGASAWWDDQADLYSLLPSNDAKKREGKSFGSYASSIQKGLYSYISGVDGSDIRSYEKVRDKYSALLTSLSDKYGNKPGAIRDIALLFAMLPAVYQPTDLLLKINKTALKATGMNKGTNEDSFPPNYQSDFTLLLPNMYQVLYNQSTKSFNITPNINLFEIVIRRLWIARYSDDIWPTVIPTTLTRTKTIPRCVRVTWY